MIDTTADFAVDVDKLVTHHDVQLPSIKLHYVEAGPEDGQVVLLLHGFPEFWYSWRHQIIALAHAGYRVIAPDQRGYNTSEKPSGVSNYTIDKLTGDMVELLDHLGVEKARVVGHDWGAVVAWFFAMAAPERLERLAILNVPHPVTFQKGLLKPRQMMRSWYMAFFQIPAIPEAAIGALDGAWLRRLFRTDPVNEDAFSDKDIDRYVEAIVKTGAARTMVNWYRAAARTKPKDFLAVIEHQVLVIWGTEDLALGEELAEPPQKWVPNYRVEKLHASHWVQCDAPERVNALLLHFLAEP